MHKTSWSPPSFLSSPLLPAHIYYADRLKKDANDFQNGMRQFLPDAKLWYSVKTNPLLQLNKDLEQIGYNFELTTMADLVVARELKIRPDRLVYNAFSRLLEEIDFAISDIGCRFLQLDSPLQVMLLLDNLKKYPQKASEIEVSLRIHSGHGHFGFGRFHKSLIQAIQTLLNAGVKCSGLHIHRNTSGGFSTAKEQAKNFRENFSLLWEQKIFLEKEIPLLYLRNFNLGGGVPSPFIYRLHHSEYSNYWDKGILPTHAHSIADSIESTAQAIGLGIAEEIASRKAQDLQIHFEPGRAICTRAFDTVAKVVGSRTDLYPDKKIVLCGIHTQQLSPIKVERHPYSFYIHQNREIKPATPSIVYGNLPYEYDILLPNAELPDLWHGDLIVFHHTGAYTLPFEGSFGYNRMTIIDGNNGKILRKAETPFDAALSENWNL